MGRRRGRHRRRKDRTLPFGTAVIVASAVAGVYLTASPDGASAVAVTVVVAPDGSDSAQGTLKSPYRTLEKAFEVAGRGTTIEVRGGTYHPAATLRGTVDGSSDERVRVRPYRSERVVLDGSRLPAGAPLVTLRADYWTLAGLELRAAPAGGLVCHSCTGAQFKDLTFHGNGDTGLTLSGAGSSHNLIQDVDSYDNHDDATGGSRADGIALTHGSGTGNRITGTRAYHNSDDGVDLWDWAGPVTIEHTWAYGNGRNRWHIDGFTGDGSGFQLGGGPLPPAADHVVRSSAAWDNTQHGFASGGNSGALLLSRDTAFGNEARGFSFPDSRARLTHDLAVDNGRGAAELGRSTVSTGNDWDPGVPTPPLFTTDSAAASADRLPDGSLPLTSFLLVADRTAIGAPMD